jgi:Icc-related predicted phosphoesterase
VRIFFATDVHGSEVCWKKFLNSGKHYQADVIILGGDMTGKALVPIVDDGGGRWHATLLENRQTLEGEEQVREFEEAVIRRGYYPFRVDPDELRALSQDEPRWHALFEQHMLATVERWMQMADERLAERIQKMVDQVTNPPERTIFSLHCPPYGTGLDDAPELTAEMDLKDAGHAVKPVGSTAVRDAIEKFQPALALHGHIHEARGTKRLGKTLCVNPGSSYEQGQLLGAIIDIDDGKTVKKFMLTSG